MDRSCNAEQWTPSRLGRSTNILALTQDQFTVAIKVIISTKSMYLGDLGVRHRFPLSFSFFLAPTAQAPE